MRRKGSSSRFLPAVLLVLSWPAHAQAPATNKSSCDRLTAAEMADCLGRELSDEHRQLDALYRAALAKLSDPDPGDRRRSRSQLAQAQSAWTGYVEANCGYVGGQEGGSNSWVSMFEAMCLRDAYRDRIAFFRHLPSQAH